MGIRSWVGKLSPVAVAGFAILAVAALVTGSVYAYRTYDYIQHDNDFCMSCHLMQEPYERFARSAHRDLGCKACHQPSFVERSTMALTQVIENPDTLAIHAEVPNERCEACHVEGNPEQWVLVSQSAGHRVHFESQDSALQGLNCVECHSTSVHEFAPSDRTCGQAGCHESTEIRLGGMGALTIHCATCHDFDAPAGAVATDALTGELRPEREECLSCHAMRQLVTDLPLDDPHGGACGACHNPHEQAVPADAVASCTEAGCHDAVEDVTPYHRGLELALADCLACHRAHDFSAADETCATCHADAVQPGVLGAVRVTGMSSESRPFAHAQHAGVECTACHSAATTHGALTLAGPAECLACHHVDNRALACSECHTTGSLPDATVRRQVVLDVGTRAQRALPFAHDVHAAVTCAQCHTGPPDLSAATVDCAECHTEHHEPTTMCSSCHTQPPASAHTLDAHLTCSGSGCHASELFDPVPRERSFCLVCHQNLFDHRPGRDCAACHALTGGGP